MVGNEKINISDITDKIVKSYGKEERHVIPILQSLQDELNFLPEEALKRVCATTYIKPSQIISVATFYSNFRLEEVGKHIVKVCVGTACHIKGAQQVYDAFKRHFGIEQTGHTDAKGLFTVEKVACLGCCTIAPVVQIDNQTYGQTYPDNISEVVDDFLDKEFASFTPKKQNKKRELVSQGEVRIGLGSCCVASGSSDVQRALTETIRETGIHVNVKHVGCIGMCHQVPLLEIQKPGKEAAFYNKIKPSDIRDILLTHFKPTNPIHIIKNGIFTFFDTALDRIVEDNKESFALSDTHISPFLNKQLHIATECYGELKPLDFEEYQRNLGFVACRKALKNWTGSQVVEEVKKSSLRGKGGGGFLSGVKWEMVSKEQSDQKYIICNGDEGDPGAFMDRMLIESYPFRIIEGMILAAYAVGASKGFLYIRAEYPLAVQTMNKALKMAYDKNILGQNILDSHFSLDLEIFEGAGAFVCGEETALIQSIEGQRGNPVFRPPFPAKKGLWNKPTLINNAETFCSVPWIIRNGSKKYAAIGTEKSKGTKVFALAGKIKKGGLIEVPMGITIKEIIEDIGGGINDNKKFKAVQIGGPSGGCIPASMAHHKVDFESLIELGAMMGSGGLIVMDETDCMVDIAKYFLAFTQDQSCGKCTFCRVGTKRMLAILERITAGKGKMEDLDTLESLSKNIKIGSLCGLGRTAPNPVISTLKYFRDEYIAHIEGHCPSKKCEQIITYSINKDCIGCSKCAQRCPTDAINGEPHQLYEIDVEKCIKCDICKQICPTDAVEIK